MVHELFALRAVGARDGFGDRTRVGFTVGDRRLEDRGVGRHTDDCEIPGVFLERARVDEVPVEIVEPNGNARRRKGGKVGVGHQLSSRPRAAFTASIDSSAAATTAAGVMPNSL